MGVYRSAVSAEDLPVVKRPLLSDPVAQPRPMTKQIGVRLPVSLVNRLEKIRELHNAAYKIGTDSGHYDAVREVTQTELIETFLKWAADHFEESIGGQPKSDSEFQKAAKKVLELLRSGAKQ